jgi:phosphoglycerate dehydrogenase-like enzyme
MIGRKSAAAKGLRAPPALIEQPGIVWLHRHRSPQMPAHTQIAILDDDHVIRLLRYALSGQGEITAQWARDFFLPEEVDPATVQATGRGLHPGDGVTLIPMSARLNLRAGSDASILIFRRGIVDAAMIRANPKLKLIQRIGARPDPIDLAAAKNADVAVSCVPRRTLHYTAEHAILLMLALAKNLLAADAAVRGDRWDRARVHPENGVAYNWAGIPDLGGLFGKTVGIIGLGEVGALAAGMARGFGARVLYANRNRLPAEQEQRLGVTFAPLAQLLAQSDFVSVHASNLPENKGMLGAAIFAQMKRTAYFINTSRGRMVDEDALYDALTKSTIAGAGLDVHFEEPRPAPDKFAALKNVILTPHLAGGSRRGVLEEIETVLDNCRAALARQPLKFQVA